MLGQFAGTHGAGFQQGQDLATHWMGQSFEDGIDTHGVLLRCFSNSFFI
jgi:hypothetical protein